MKCHHGHKPPAGHRELGGAEREKALRRLEAIGAITRVKIKAPLTPQERNTCFHIYSRK